MHMKTPHKHAELIKAWADGAEIQINLNYSGKWGDCTVWGLSWNPEFEYRIKPAVAESHKPKPDVVTAVEVICKGRSIVWNSETHTVACANLKLTFDGETGKLKSAEVL